MKRIDDQRSISTNLQGSARFNIQDSPEAFRILSDGIYSDKYRAVIRELSCNAWDAQVMAGNTDVPFQVHLPNRLEPYFSVQDFGVGMDIQFASELFTTYFYSNKGDTNKATGYLGLGSKAPFSYTDTFTITTIKDGFRHILVAYLDEERIPSINVVSRDEKTTEHSGVTVSFPVKADDYEFTRFREAAEVVFRPFAMKPQVFGNSGYTCQVYPTVATEGIVDDCLWEVYEDTYNYNLPSVTAIQGNVEYPISRSALSGALTDYEQGALASLNLSITFPIGCVGVAASREELSYTPKTIENIVSVVRVIVADLEDKIVEAIEAEDTEWDAAVRYQQMSAGVPYGLAQAVQKRTTFNGKPIADLMYRKLILEDYNVGQIRTYTRLNQYTERISPKKYTYKVEFNVSSKTKFLINDTTKGPSRSRQFLLDHTNYTRVILLESKNKELLQALGNPEVDLASNYEPAVKYQQSSTGVKGKKRSAQKQFMQLYPTPEGKPSEDFYSMKGKEVYLIEGKLWKQRGYYSSYDFRGHMSVDGNSLTENQIVDIFKIANVQDVVVYGVNEAETKTKRFSKYLASSDCTWKTGLPTLIKTLFPIVKDSLTATLVEEEAGSEYNRSYENTAYTIYSHVIKRHSNIDQVEEVLGTDNPFVKSVRLILDQTQNKGKGRRSHMDYYNAKVLYRTLFGAYTNQGIVNKCETLDKELEERYPLISMLTYRYVGDMKEAGRRILDYMKLVESCDGEGV